MADYIDTSAFIKLVRSEPESRSLRQVISESDGALVSSVLLEVEARRAAARYGSRALTRAHVALATITLLAIDEATVDTAATLQPPELRSLDALHLAAVIGLGEDVGRVYCYDSRLAQAAIRHGLDVCQPR